MERAVAKNELADIFKSIGPDKGKEGRMIFQEIRNTKEPDERKLEIEIASRMIKAENSSEEGVEDFKFVKANKNPKQSLKKASEKFLKIIAEVGNNNSNKARELFVK